MSALVTDNHLFTELYSDASSNSEQVLSCKDSKPSSERTPVPRQVLLRHSRCPQVLGAPARRPQHPLPAAPPATPHQAEAPACPAAEKDARSAPGTMLQQLPRSQCWRRGHRAPCLPQRMIPRACFEESSKISAAFKEESSAVEPCCSPAADGTSRGGRSSSAAGDFNYPTTARDPTWKKKCSN